MNARRFYCTLADRNYLVRALALIESLQRHEKRDWVLYFVCLDELTRAVLGALALPNVVLVPLHALERGDQPLLATRGQRSLVEYYWTLTPSLILKLLASNPNIDVLTYLDADLYFFSSPDAVYDELGPRSLLIHEHRFTPDLAHLKKENGRFNVGLLSFRRDDTGLGALTWWRERCLEWCFHRSEAGKMGDQMYLDDWPTRFAGVAVLQNPGAALAPWNHAQYQLEIPAAGPPTVDGHPAVFFHFQSLAVPHPSVLVAAKHSSYPMTEAVLRGCYAPYAEALWRGARLIRPVHPQFSFGLSEAVNVSDQHTVLLRQDAPPVEGLETRPRLALPGPWQAALPATAPARVAAIPASPPAAPRASAATSGSEDQLLVDLLDRPLTRQIEVLYFVGAHRFQEAELLFQLFPRLRLVCLFEPLPALHRMLKALEQQDRRIRVFPYAVSDRDGPATFNVTSNDAASSSLLALGTHRDLFPHVGVVDTITVEARTLPGIIARHDLPAPDMLLLDTQGAEYKILSALTPELKRRIRLIYTEASTEEIYQGGRTLEDIEQLLAPEFAYLAFAPLAPHTPTHGNALFVNQQSAELLRRV